MNCRTCTTPIYTGEPHLKYTDVYGVEALHHVECWNKSIYGEVGRRREE